MKPISVVGFKEIQFLGDFLQRSGCEMLLSASLDGGTLNLLGCFIPELLCAHS